MKRSLTVIGIILSTVILAVLAVVTAVRIKNLGTRPVAPTAPESKPKAEEGLPPDDAVPEEAACKKVFQVQVTAVACDSLKAYRNDSRNTAGTYYREDEIAAGETVAKGEKIVFQIDTLPSVVPKPTTLTMVLPVTLTYVDGGSTCQYSSATKTVTCNKVYVTDAPRSTTFFRVAVANDANSAISATVEVRAEGEAESTCSITLLLEGQPSPTPTPTPEPTSTPMPGPYCSYLHADPTGGPVPLTVDFEGKGYDPTRVKGFRFAFGDGEKKEVFGSFTTSHIETVEHTYATVGTYKAKLEVMDDGDHWLTRNECEVTVQVTGKTTTTPSVSVTKAATPTEAELPVAGIKIPTLGGIMAGFLLIAIGAALVF